MGQVPDWVHDAVFYQIFPERFANGDPTNNPPGSLPWGGEPTRENFFGGDLQGIIDHLDHIVDLGANAVYLTPIFEAETNHRYDCVDYERIDPYLGDLDTFRRFVDEAHARGIRVVLDAVFNHCGKGHWAFQDVVRRGRESPYQNWFYVEDFPVRVAEAGFNYSTCGGAYYLPQWNVHNAEVRDYLFAITQRWIGEGIDGWRLDVPYYMNTSFWRRFRELVKGIDPDLYIVAEYWDVATDWVRGDLADAAMNYPMRDLILGLVADGTHSPKSFADGMTELYATLPGPAHAGMLNLLGSHDTERLLTRCGEDRDRLRQAVALLVSTPGVPMVYYGDEVGLAGENDPGCRACMPWDQSAWDTAIYDWTRIMLRLRRDHPSLSRGADVFLHVDDSLVIRLREVPGDAVLVAVNVGDGPVAVPADALAGRDWRDVETGALVDDAIVTPRGVVVLTASGTVVSADGRED